MHLIFDTVFAHYSILYLVPLIKLVVALCWYKGHT
jgi:hypothetical protein